MPRYAEVEGLSQPLEFPDDTPDAVMDVRVRQAVRDQQASNISAGQRRDAARARPTAFQRMMGNVTSGAGQAISQYSPPGSPDLPEQNPALYNQPGTERGRREATSALEYLIPQNEIQALSLAGTAGAGGLAAKIGLRGLGAAATRIAGGAIGGETGGQVSGEPTGKGAAVGGIGSALLEIMSPLIGKLLRSRPGFKSTLANREAADIGTQMRKNAPIQSTLAPPQTGTELQQVVRDPRAYLHRLQDVMEDAARNVEAQIGNAPLNIPSLADDPTNLVAQNLLPMSEVRRKLSMIGQQGFGGGKVDPFKRSVQGLDNRELYSQVIDEVAGELDRLDPSGRASAIFNQSRDIYKKGKAYLDLLRSPGAFRQYSNEVQLNQPGVQRAYTQKQGQLRPKLGDKAAGELERTLFRGGSVGTQDMPITEAGHTLDALRGYLGAGGGSVRFFSLPLRTLLPNLASQYAGRAPYSPTQGQKLLFDLLGVKGAGELTR